LRARDVQAQTTKALGDLVGWQVPGLETVTVEGVTLGDGYFTGSLPALSFSGASAVPVVAGFAVAGSAGWVVVISFRQFTLPDYLGPLPASILGDLAFSDLRLVIAPSGTGGTTARPPAQVAHVAGTSLSLPADPSVSGTVALTGTPGDLMAALGVGVSALPVSGKLPVGLFTGGIEADRLATALYPLLDLTISAPASLLAAAKSPIPGATLDSLSLHLDGAGGRPAFELSGGVTLAGQALQVTASGTDGGDGPTIEITGDMTLGQLSGADVPGLSDISVGSLRIDRGSLAGALTFRDVEFDVVLFETPGHASPNVALLVPELKLSTLSPAFAGTPFDDLQLKPAGLVLVPSGNGETRAKVPQPVSDHTGKEEMDLQPGLNLASLAAATGMVGDLLDLLKVPKTGLPMGGTLDPSIFGNAAFGSADAAALAKEIEIDLSVPLGAISIPGAPDFFTSSGNQLSLTNGPSGFVVAVVSDVRVELPGGDPLDFTGTRIALGQEDGHEFADISGHADIAWPHPFGIEWINLHGLDLSARFGTVKEFSIGSRTDLGSVKGLDVATSMVLYGSTIQEAGISLMGKDIPLNAIPIFSSFPSVGEFVLRDITVSNTAIAGKARLKDLPTVDAVLFKSQQPQPGWNLAMVMSGLGLKDIIPDLPGSDALDEVLAQVKLDDLVLMMSEHGVTDQMTSLPKAAQQRLTEIFGAAANPRISDGLGLLGGFDPTSLSAEARQALSALGLGEQKLVLGGTVGGILGGTTPSFELKAMLPAVTLPDNIYKEIQFLGLPESAQGAFYVRFLSATELGFGMELITSTRMPTQTDTVLMDTEVYLEVNPTGGLSAGVKGTTQSPWHRAFGIDGFDMLAGCELGVSISATSEIHMTAKGHAQVGAKEVEVTGAFGVIVGDGVPVPSRGAFTGQLDALSLGDVMALTNAVATVGGGDPIKPDFPDVKLTDIVIGFASPLETVTVKKVDSDQTLTLAGPGVVLGGKLWMFFPDSPLGQFDGKIDLSGLTATGAIHDFTLGGLTMTGNNLDVAATTDIADPPHFRFNGNATIEGTSTVMHMDAEVTSFTFSAAQTFGGANFAYDFGVYYHGPSSFTAQGLQDLDLGVDVALEVDGIQAFLAGPGADAAKRGLDDVKAATDNLTQALTSAQTAVNTLSDSVKHYRAVAQADQRDRNQALTDAQQRVADVEALIDGLDSQITATNKKIRSDCTSKKNVCVSLPIVGRTCRKVDDLAKETKCGADNASYALDVKRLQGERLAASQAQSRAQDALKLVQDGNQAIPIDDDPRVAGWIDLQKGAEETLQSAQVAVADVQAATDAANRAIQIFQAGSSAVRVTRGHLRGSLKEMTTSHPLILDVDYMVSGRQLTTRIPFNLVDMTYTSRYLELLALQAAYVVTQNDPNASDMVKKAFRDQYLAKQTETDTEVDAVNQLNNVLPDSGTDGED
jgi:hypothetical protein